MVNEKGPRTGGALKTVEIGKNRPVLVYQTEITRF